LDKLRAINSIVRIVESGSLTAAATDLNVSLPSMVRACLPHWDFEIEPVPVRLSTRVPNNVGDGSRFRGIMRQ